MTDNIIFREGFDTYNGVGNQIGVGCRWRFNRNPSIGAGRLGGQALHTHDIITPGPLCDAAFDSEATNVTLGFALYFTEFYESDKDDVDICLKTSGSDLHKGFMAGIKLAGDGRLILKRGNNLAGSGVNNWTTLGSTPVLAVTPATWHYVEWESLLATDATGWGKVYINGSDTPSIDVSGVQTSVGSILAGRVGIGATTDYFPQQRPMYVDDMYARDIAVRLGQRRIETIRVAGNGAHQDSVPSTGTDRAALLDESVPDTADFVTLTNVGDYDEYTVTPLAGNASVIDEVTMIGYAQKTDAATRAFNLGIDSGGTVDDGPDLYMATTVGKYQRSMPLNPDGDINWTRTDVEALLMRPKVAV